jgi:chromosomal replication initiation ATPase DnaA
MRIILGDNAYLKLTQNRIEPVVWDSQSAMNAHIMIMGGSGAGKTHLARRLLNDMTKANAGRYTQAKLKALYLGADSAAAAALEQTNRKAQALYSKLRSLGQVSTEQVKADPDIQDLKLIHAR